jgi:predicted pyridoxine 5'-phosphate oxidase superfamily flavin-nucleotide-binding protein
VELTPDMQRVVLEQSLGFVATVTPDGRPNLSPKGTTTVFDANHLMFADVASPQTVANLASNPNVEVNVVDPIVRKGYRFKGTATVHTGGSDVRAGHRRDARTGLDDRARADPVDRDHRGDGRGCADIACLRRRNERGGHRRALAATGDRTPIG